MPVDCSVADTGVPTPGEFLSILDPLQVEAGQVSYVVVGVEHRVFGVMALGPSRRR